MIQKLNKDDYVRLKEIAMTMNDDKLEIFDGMDQALVERMLSMFEDVASKDSHLIVTSSKAVE